MAALLGRLLLIVLSCTSAAAALAHRAPLRAHAAAHRTPPRMNVVDLKPCWANDFLTLQPTYRVSDWAKARPIMAEYLDKARTERGAMYCGWTTCGDKLFCREAFADADFVLAHVALVRPTIEKLLASGAATLEEVELHGPADALSKCDRDAMAPFDARLFEIDAGVTFLVRPYAGMSRGQSHFSLQPTFTVADWGAAQPLLDEAVERMRAGASASGRGRASRTERAGKALRAPCRASILEGV
eukprot:7384540-Prymnesium_polylepis.1